ncbi:hypothetical protein DDE82_001882 [Stemphylium lycopersici]|nr:hypothetical protein DDE82_001882 [Stemphylium lycopersici]
MAPQARSISDLTLQLEATAAQLCVLYLLSESQRDRRMSMTIDGIKTQVSDIDAKLKKLCNENQSLCTETENPRAFTVSLCDRTKSTSLRICVFPAPLLPTLRPDTHSRPLSRSSLVEFAKATAVLSTGPPLRLPGYLAITFERSLAMNGDQQKGQRAPQPRTWKLPLAKNNAANPLAVALAQYPILETMVSFLPPKALVTMTQVSQTLHSHIAKTFHSAVGCAANGFLAESRPCTECGVNTCNECRIHVFYNHLTEDAGFDQRRWWAGFFFLNPVVVAAVPPKHEDSRAWYRPIESMGPLHDQGRVHIPLCIPALGDPEPMDRLLDLDLGSSQIITPHGRSQDPYSGREIVSFLNATIMARKELVCSSCFKERQKKYPTPCSCTLRKRFLDRWLCVGCYIEEEEADKDLECHIAVGDDVGGHHHHHHLCDCGATIGSGSRPKLICNWCKGEITGKWADNEDDHGDVDDENAGEVEEDEERYEEHSAADFADLDPDELGYAKNRDGTLSVYVNGTCVRGEHVGRAIIRGWREAQGIASECICCKCEAGDFRHNHQVDAEEADENGDAWETDPESGMDVNISEEG